MIPLPTPTKKIEFTKNQQVSIQKKQQTTLNKVFRLTQRINQLSNAHIYQRNLSPWTRKRNQSIDRKNYNAEDTLNTIENNSIKINQHVKNNNLNSLNQNKMDDFLRKIQFTKKRKFADKSPTDKKTTVLNQEQLSQFNQKIPTYNTINFHDQQIKQLIIYPKNEHDTNIGLFTRNSIKQPNSTKNKQFSQRKFNTSIQNFYDPYQNSSKGSQNLYLHRKSSNFNFNPQSLSNRTNKNPTFINLIPKENLSYTQRRNSLNQKSKKRIFYQNLKENHPNQNLNNYMGIEQNRTLYQQNAFSRIKRRKSITSKCFTEQCQKQFQKTFNPQNIEVEVGSQQKVYDISYATPSTPAIKRLKQKYRKNQRFKTQYQNKKLQKTSTNNSIHKRDNRQFLYQTFAHYKNKKYSNDLNIKKTLKLNYFNQRSFNQNFHKNWNNSQK